MITSLVKALEATIDGGIHALDAAILKLRATADVAPRSLMDRDCLDLLLRLRTPIGRLSSAEHVAANRAALLSGLSRDYALPSALRKALEAAVDMECLGPSPLQLSRQLPWHRQSVALAPGAAAHNLSVQPAMRLVATGCRIWDASTGWLLYEIPGTEDGWDGAGDFVVSWTWKFITVRNVVTGTTNSGAKRRYPHVVLAFANGTVVSLNINDEVDVWDHRVAHIAELRPATLRGQHGPTELIRLGANRAGWREPSGSVIVWQVDPPALLGEREVGEKACVPLPDGRLAVIDNAVVVVWDPASGREWSWAHHRPAEHVQVRGYPDGRLLIVTADLAGEDRALIEAGVEPGLNLRGETVLLDPQLELIDRLDAAKPLGAVVPDRRHIVAYDALYAEPVDDDRVALAEPGGASGIAIIPVGSSGPVRSSARGGAWSAVLLDDERLLTIHDTGGVCWALPGCEEIGELKLTPSEACSSLGYGRVAVGSRPIEVWDASSGVRLATFRGQGATPLGVFGLGPERLVVVGTANGAIEIWSPAETKRVAVATRDAVIRAAPLASGHVVVCSDEELLILHPDGRTVTRAQPVATHGRPITELAVLDDYILLQVGSPDASEAGCELWHFNADLKRLLRQDADAPIAASATAVGSVDGALIGLDQDGLFELRTEPPRLHGLLDAASLAPVTRYGFDSMFRDAVVVGGVVVVSRGSELALLEASQWHRLGVHQAMTDLTPIGCDHVASRSFDELRVWHTPSRRLAHVGWYALEVWLVKTLTDGHLLLGVQQGRPLVANLP